MQNTIIKEGETYNNKTPLYNIRLLRSYIDYVYVNYPDVDIDKILKYAGVTKFQYNDYGYWCNQQQMNRLQEILLEETANKNISRDTGRNLVNTQNIIAQYIFGFINPANLTRQIEKVYKKISRGAIIQIKYLGNNRHELITTPLPGVKEELYQCKNRIGSLEGLLKLFLHEYPRIDHPECYHRDANYCKYIVSWNKLSGTFKWFRFRNYSIFVGVLISLVTLLLFPFNYFLISSSLSCAIIAFMFYQLQKIEKNKLVKNVEETRKTYEDLWSELNIRYSVTKLVQEVGEITSVIRNEQEIACAVSYVMSKRLDYNRGLILLAMNNAKSLFLAGGSGFTEKEILVINNSWLGLDSNNKSVLQKVFKRQEPILIEDMSRSNDFLASNDFEIARKLKIQSMICVPIVHEGESLGVIVVDSLKSQKEFREGDINLLMAVASQTALSIAARKSIVLLLRLSGILYTQ
jgi:hypothetical protein